MICFKSKWFSFVRSLFIILKYQFSNVELSFSINMIKLKNFADLLPAMMNDERNSRSSRRDLVKSTSRNTFLSCSLTSASFNSWIFFYILSFFWSETILSRRRFLSFFIIKQRSCTLMIIWEIFFFFNCSQLFTHSMTISRFWFSFSKWNQTCSKSVFIQCFNCCWLLIWVEKMTFSILFDISDERIDIRCLSIYCNKVEIFF